LPTDWTPVIDENELEDEKLTHAAVDGVPIAIVKSGGDIHAMLDRCSHRGCSLHEGDFDGRTITCPCHGSTFKLDGSVVKGPATFPQPTFDVRVADGRVEINTPS
jgi:nitrite reductase/ring-hydroxylating ferredoxin subunit